MNSGATREHLRKFATTEAAVWEASPYYDDAEQWTFLFWDEHRPFRPMFSKLDLTFVVELACGRGRHAERLINLLGTGRYFGTDILLSNIEACRERIGRSDQIEFHPTDGISLPVPDETATALFCYDAMVHFDIEVIIAYLRDTARILSPGGRALFHHSNYSSNPGCPYGLNPMARNFMSLDLFAHLGRRADLYPIEQRTIPWGNFANLDGLTLFEKRGKSAENQ